MKLGSYKGKIGPSTTKNHGIAVWNTRHRVNIIPTGDVHYHAPLQSLNGSRHPGNVTE